MAHNFHRVLRCSALVGVAAAISSSLPLSSRMNVRMQGNVKDTYRNSVASLFSKGRSFPLITKSSSAVKCIQYSHIGLGCQNLTESVSYYTKLGFKLHDDKDKSGIICLRNINGLELHLIQAEASLKEHKNILMDYSDTKPPGHTHASWKVPSVPGVTKYLASLNIPLSGTRSTLAVFVRDPDRTTLEFERNDGQDDACEVFTADMIGFNKTLDHVGTRIRAPYDRHLEWYAKNLGFVYEVRTYVTDSQPLKNFSPFITRTETDCDINFIPNCNTPPPSAGETEKNALVQDHRLRPGIFYVAFDISEDWSTAYAKLKSNDVDVVVDTELLAGKTWGDFPKNAIRPHPRGPTLLLRDLNGSLIRLVPK